MHIPCISQLLKSKSSAFCKLELQLPKQLLTREMLLAMDEAKPLILLGVTLGVTLQLHQVLCLLRKVHCSFTKYCACHEICAHEICVPAAGVPPAEHENAKTRKRQARKREKTKTRKRRKRENGENTIHSVVL